MNRRTLFAMLVAGPLAAMRRPTYIDLGNITWNEPTGPINPVGLTKHGELTMEVVWDHPNCRCVMSPVD